MKSYLETTLKKKIHKFVSFDNKIISNKIRTYNTVTVNILCSYNKYDSIVLFHYLELLCHVYFK